MLSFLSYTPNLILIYLSISLILKQNYIFEHCAQMETQKGEMEMGYV